MSKGFAISAYSECNDKLLRFARQQSQHSRECEWEDRAHPVRGWGRDLRDAAGCVLFCVVVCALLWGA